MELEPILLYINRSWVGIVVSVKATTGLYSWYLHFPRTLFLVPSVPKDFIPGTLIFPGLFVWYHHHPITLFSVSSIYHDFTPGIFIFPGLYSRYPHFPRTLFLVRNLGQVTLGAKVKLNPWKIWRRLYVEQMRKKKSQDITLKPCEILSKDNMIWKRVYVE